MRAVASFLLGIGVGSAALVGWQHIRGADKELLLARAELAEVTSRCGDLKADAVASKRRLLELSAVNEDLSGRLIQQPPSAASVAGSAPPMPPPAFPPALGDETMARTFHSNHLKEDAERWKRRLQLTVAQAELVDRALAQDLASVATVPLREMFKIVGFRQELERILTPEQKAKYEAIQQREKREGAEMGARFELGQVERAVELTEAQRQAVIERFKDRNPLDMVPPDAAPDEQNPLAHVRESVDKRVEALRGVLTDVQLEEYRDYLLAQLDQMESMMKARAPSKPAR